MDPLSNLLVCFEYKVANYGIFFLKSLYKLFIIKSMCQIILPKTKHGSIKNSYGLFSYVVKIFFSCWHFLWIYSYIFICQHTVMREIKVIISHRLLSSSNYLTFSFGMFMIMCMTFHILLIFSELCQGLGMVWSRQSPGGLFLGNLTEIYCLPWDFSPISSFPPMVIELACWSTWFFLAYLDLGN